ncbi:putative exosome component 5, partial [Obelidium mucronatum]
MKRSDGRTELLQMRPLSASVSLLSRSDGSARFAFGGAGVVCGVFGPAEGRGRDAAADGGSGLAAVRVSAGRGGGGAAGPGERLAELLVRRCCERVVARALFPRAAVAVTLQPTAAAAASLAAAVNAACLALLDAAVPLAALLAAVHVAVAPDGAICLDPDDAEVDAATSVHTFVFNNADDCLVEVVSEGIYSEAVFKQATAVAKEACSAIHAFYRQTFSQKLLSIN